jgi:peroxiredoxin
MKFRKTILFTFFVLSTTALVSWVFWEHELKYAAPTPMPDNFVDVAIGTEINLATLHIPSGKSALLHFFNPDCPCSKFNMKEFGALARKYKDQVNFVVILQSSDESQIAEFKTKYELNVPVLADKNGQISDMCGIYATPQAVILNNSSQVYFKGNYNKSRFCTHKQTRFVEIALDSLVANRPLPAFVLTELMSPYGCELPSDNQDQESGLSNLFNL